MYTIEDKTKLIHDFKQYSDKEDSYCSYSYEGVEAIYDFIDNRQYEFEDEDLRMFKFWCGLTYTDIRIIFNEIAIKDIDDLKDHYDEELQSELNEFLNTSYDSEVLSNGDELVKVYKTEYKTLESKEILETKKLISVITIDLSSY
tara:strand:+ start:41 stop:475 length:435 start_codon:yes stop_codon:yes gene_type:complete